ncbi:MAG: hypothetical protein M1823_005621 [Watsoniomyces obsoletus]|nr:MAG: hypothetical protein M1823_005621 [Watsoniomyces obsoletus]
MATVAPKMPYHASRGNNSNGGTSRTAHTNMRASINTNHPSRAMPNHQQHHHHHHGTLASPTESEFSDVYDPADSVRSWDEKQVGEWLRSINYAQYEDLFRTNNFNGDNLLECDQAVLKELGIKKIGDRVRVFLAIKSLRTHAYSRQKKRNRVSGRPQYKLRKSSTLINRQDSFATLDSSNFTPPSGSPRALEPIRERLQGAAAANRRFSRHFDGSTSSNPPTAVPVNLGRVAASPPAFDPDGRPLGTPRLEVSSPNERARREQHGHNYFSNPSSAHTVSGRQPDTPASGGSTDLAGAGGRGGGGHHRQVPSMDGSFMGSLPRKVDWLRVIYAGGETKVVDVQRCKTSEDIFRCTLRRFHLQEHHHKNYCFYVLDGVDPDPARCRRISDAELMRINGDRSRPERNRLILRKVHAGEPVEEELQRAAKIAAQESTANQATALAKTSNRNQQKLTQLTGESWETLQYPLSPISYGSASHSPYLATDPNRSGSMGGIEVDEDRLRPQPPPPPPPPPPSGHSQQQSSTKAGLRRFFGQRPPSELISNDLAYYFPEHGKEEIEKTVRMSMRRSARLSRATSRLSTVSNLSIASSLKDAPPIPSIAETWLTGGNQAAKLPRPLSVVRVGPTSYRDSVASSVLEPLPEESPVEPNRKSYVSFESGSEGAPSVAPPAIVTDGGHSSNSLLQSYFDDGTGSNVPADGNASLTHSLQQALAEDGEEKDEELTQFLESDSWDNLKWIRGALIGQGSFGSVFLALHTMTGELMAVKQVEMPSDSGTAMDHKKRAMVNVLKHEISLLREIQHPNIVQYLGSSSDDEHLNIFLEYVPGGSVAAMLTQYGPLREPLIRNFVRQILTGLAYLHGRDIIHRDIKGANVLVDNKGGIKISDFGISKRDEASSLLNSGAGHKNRPSLQGSVFWMAPEVVKQTSYTRKADIWSLGCLVVEMFTGNHPYPDCSQLQAIFKIGDSKASPTLPTDASEEAKTFLRQTFEIDHNKRPSADELLLSPFLNPIAG